MQELEKGTKVKGKTVDKGRAVREGEIISVLARTVIVSTSGFGNVVMKKDDVTVIEK